MRRFLKSSGRWLSAGWFWPLILLALPNCALQTGGLPGLPDPHTFDPGTGDLSSAVMCDIPHVQDNGTSSMCASQGDMVTAMPLLHAAVALADGESNNSVLDFSPDPQNPNMCNGQARRIDFFGPYPAGFPVCLNCDQKIPTKYPDPRAVCVAKCKELVAPENPPGGVDQFCEGNAKVSTNFAPNICFKGRCTMGGTAVGNFADPRWNAEPVQWTDLIGAQDLGNGDLQRTAMTTGMTVNDFNAGAASVQLIMKGDAWVEFGAAQTDNAVVIGVRQSTDPAQNACTDVTQCPDQDPSSVDTGFGMILNTDASVYVYESGNPPIGPIQPYLKTDRFRIHIEDQHDGTANITYKQVTGLCTPGSMCAETPLTAHVGTGVKYPLRIDTTFLQQFAKLTNVTVMRIKDK
jgi:hypothetical protein